MVKPDPDSLAELVAAPQSSVSSANNDRFGSTLRTLGRRAAVTLAATLWLGAASGCTGSLRSSPADAEADDAAPQARRDASHLDASRLDASRLDASRIDGGGRPDAADSGLPSDASLPPPADAGQPTPDAGPMCVPSDERCNAVDDDCDEAVDESLTRRCGTGVGRCRYGSEACASGSWGSCSGGTGPRSERCDDVDDDCDGTIDEGLAHPHTACSPPNPSGTYEAYPAGGGPYVTGDASAAYPWPGDDFESYGDGEVVECRSNQGRRSHLDVTSGCLYGRYAGTWRRGWTTTHNFRALAIGRDGSSIIRWRDQTAQYRGYIDRWQSGAPVWAGLHVFVRYQTENDLYVASLRRDGDLTIKKKHCGTYTTLARTSGPAPDVGRWYRLRFEARGTTLRFYVDGTLRLSATDCDLSWGTTGIRTDYADVWLDDWRLVY